MIAIISHPDCLLHSAGDMHPERPDRVKVIQDALKQYNFKSKPAFFQASLAKPEQLKLVHDAEYVDWIFTNAPKDRLIRLDEDTLMNPYSLQAARRAAGAVIDAVDLVMEGRAQAVFCNIRPPGHHAEADKAMGFCIFNNVAVGVAYAMQRYGLERIAIVDFDVHRGNGTQAIFQEDKRVLFCSSFEHPLYPGYDAAMDNEHILSVPLPAETGDKAFRRQLDAAWFEALKKFRPQLIFFSAGFDGHQDDPLAYWRLGKADYIWLTEKIREIARESCEGKMISVLEGGYNLEALADCVPAHVEAMEIDSQSS